MLKDMYSISMLFDLSTSFSKLSALAFYTRVFHLGITTSRVWDLSFYIILGLTIACLVASMLLGILQCAAIEKYWTPTIPGSCLDGFGDNWRTISNVVIDFVILVLPSPPIFRLQMKMSKKILVFVTFVLGYG